MISAAEMERVVSVEGTRNYELIPGLTLQEVKDRAIYAEHPNSWRCRHGKHKRRVIGRIWYGPKNPNVGSTGDLLAMASGAIMGSLYDSLMQCERCGLLCERLR